MLVMLEEMSVAAALLMLVAAVVLMLVLSEEMLAAAVKHVSGTLQSHAYVVLMLVYLVKHLSGAFPSHVHVVLILVSVVKHANVTIYVYSSWQVIDALTVKLTTHLFLLLLAYFKLDNESALGARNLALGT